MNYNYNYNQNENTSKCKRCGHEITIKHGDDEKEYIYCEHCRTKDEKEGYRKIQFIGFEKSHHRYMFGDIFLSTPVICLCFAFSVFVVPAILGIILLIKQYEQASFLKSKYGDAHSMDSEIEFRNAQLNYQDELLSTLEDQLAAAQKDLTDLRNDTVSETTLQIANSLDYSGYDSLTSEECRNTLSLLLQDEKDLVKNNNAVEIFSDFPKNQINNNVKQILRCFNAECDNIALSVTIKNIDSLRNKIIKCFDSLNHIFETDGFSLTKEMLEYKLKELTLMYNYEKKKAEEKEIQKAIKEQMLEEEKVRRELESKKKAIEKDQKHFSNEVAKMIKYIQKTDSEVEKQLYADKLKELEEKIKSLEAEKADVIHREENAKAGFVYIISNIGSFGEDVYKIGMTRRLEPLDRIKELSSASVPFEFDVHAMIFSDDAPALETALHHHFDNKRVNKINPRKEFFRVSLDDIESYVSDNYDSSVEFTTVPVAKEYRDTLAMA